MGIRELAEHYADEVWNQKRPQIVHEMMRPDVVLHSPLGRFFGPESAEKIVSVWLTAFPDMIYIPLLSIVEGDRVATQWEARATHRGDFKGNDPSGREITYPGCTIYRFEEDKIAEYWAYVDTQMVLDQLRDVGD